MRIFLRQRFADPALRQVAGNSTWSIGLQVIVSGAQFMETILLARYLSRDEFGVFVLVVAYPEAVLSLLDCRVRDCMTKYLGEFLVRDRKKQASALVKLLWLLDVGVGVLALTIVAVTAHIAAELIVGSDDLADAIRLFGVVLFVASLDSASGTVMRVMDRYGLVFFGGAAYAASRLTLVIFVLMSGGGLMALIWARLAAELIMTLILGGITFKLLSDLLGRDLRAPISSLGNRLSEIRSFLLNTNLSGSLYGISGKVDILLVGLLANPATVATYKIAAQFGRIFLLLTDPLFVVIYPAYAKWHSGGKDRTIREVSRRATVLLSGLLLPIGTVFAWQSAWLIQTIVGEEFVSAATPLVLLLIGAIPMAIFFWARATVLSVGDAAVSFRFLLTATLVQLTVLVILVPRAGAGGAALALAAAYLTTVGLHLQYLWRRNLL